MMPKNALGKLSFLFLVPAFFLLHNYNELFGFISLRLMTQYAILIYGALIVVYLLVNARLRSKEKTAALLLAPLLVMLFYGPLHSAIKKLPGGSFFGRYLVLLPLLFILITWLGWKIIRTPALPAKLFRFLNLLMGCLVLVELVTLVQNTVEAKRTANLIYPQKPLCENYTRSTLADSSKPDIFLLVFDEYTNNASLEKFWHYDNHNITDWLRSDGFFVEDHSAANYPCTFFSLPSLFNMNYLAADKGTDGTNARNMLRGNQSLSNNETLCLLKKENYSIQFLAPFRNSLQENGLGYVFDFLHREQLSRQTLPGSFGHDVFWHFIPASFNQSIQDDLIEKLKAKMQSTQRTMEAIKASVDSSNSRAPKFVYGHFMIPHEPNIFDSTGQFVFSQDLFTDSGRFNTYPEQVKYANRIMKDLVHYIRTQNKKNTVIMILGDHGFKAMVGGPNDLYAHANFSALYFPGRQYGSLSDSTTTVNLFRILFNQFFQQRFPLLPDSLVKVRLQ